MQKLIILGTSNAVPTETHENTHMAFTGDDRLILVDSVSNPIVRLQQAGLDIFRMTDLILTHFHPDHVSGVPSLLMDSWLMGRKTPLTIHGLAHTLDRVEKMMEFYEWSKWPNFYPVTFHRIPEVELIMLFEDDEFRVFASPVCHMIPTIGLRVEFPRSRKVMAYSCDTEPCQQVVRLASGADLLVHEATGASFGHSSAAQAGDIARQAGAKMLYLIHYQPGKPGLVDEACQTFGGPVALASDFEVVDFSAES